MKKIIFALMAVLIIFATGCEKINDNDVINRNDTNAKTLGGWRLNNTWCSECRSCDPPAKDCFDEIIVTPEKNNLLQSFIKDTISIKNFFLSGNYEDYFPELIQKHNIDILKKLQNEEYSVKIVEGKKSTFYLFQNIKNNEELFCFETITQ